MCIIFKKEGFIIMKTPKLRRYVVDLLIPEDTPISKNIPTDDEKVIIDLILIKMNWFYK